MDANVKNYEIELSRYKTYKSETTDVESKDSLSNESLYEKRREISKEFLI